MNIEWDYGYYQPWSDNEWLVDEMMVLLNKDITMQYCVRGYPRAILSDVSKFPPRAVISQIAFPLSPSFSHG